MRMLSHAAGHPVPLGATIHPEFTRFSIFSRHATRVWLMLFDYPEEKIPSYEIELNPYLNRTGDIWHIDVFGVGEGQRYLYRMDGPSQMGVGMCYNPTKGLLDPYAKAFSKPFNSDQMKHIRGYYLDEQNGQCEASTVVNFHELPKCVVTSDTFEWHGDRPLNRPLRHTIIYEAHVKGLTAHPLSGVKAAGTYEGVIQKIPYFQELGITAIEFLPIHIADQSGHGRMNPLTGKALTNYWGYNSLNFFAVEPSYSQNKSPLRAFKTMVRELHKAGIEVILDMVYNHTAEGNHLGPYFSYKGIDNPVYYLLENDRRYYRNYSGTGNTFNCNHPVIRDLILDSLRYWVIETHVDGFRFDLASILGRDQWGNLLENPPIVERIAEDPVLRDTKIIAEAWDAAGAYQVGTFPGGRWAEWNGRYRDDVRRFWRGDPGMVGALATRLAGSSDLYLRDGRSPFHSINFITSHDGFTLNDLVSYNYKHNMANGENNQDGDNNNFNANLGAEGPTTDSKIEHRRVKRIKNFLTTLLLSQGVPMLTAGDEFRRTQQGNNNAYAQDNKISWLDWSLVETHHDIFRFTKELITFRKRHAIFYREHFFGADSGPSLDIQWFSPDRNEPDWGPHSRTLMVLIYGKGEVTAIGTPDQDALLMFNNSAKTINFHLPVAPDGKAWRRIIDTAKPSPQDIRPEEEVLLPYTKKYYAVEGESMVVMLSF